MEIIDYNLDHAGFVDEQIRYLISYVLSAMPDKVVDYVVENVSFYSFEPLTRGLTINIKEECSERKHNALIILGGDFYNKTKEERYGIIAHEIGHAYHNHKNFHSTLRGEKQADDFAHKYGFKSDAYKNYKNKKI
jgi:hypothetical protein